MAKIVEYREIPLDDLVIGKGQARTQDPGKDIDELARSIEVQGLLQPIVVCPAENRDKWEILTGQRRFLAHRMLRRDNITAAVLDERVGESQAKAISITENLIRRKLTGKELIDGVTFLHNIYGSARTVADATGIPYQSVLDYVKYPRLLPELKKMVNEGTDVKVALKAQDAATDDSGKPDVETAITLVKEMEEMTGAQQKKVVKERKGNPGGSIDDVIEKARTGSKVIQLIATVTEDVHSAIRQVAKEEGTTQDEAAAALIEEALVNRELLES